MCDKLTVLATDGENLYTYLQQNKAWSTCQFMIQKTLSQQKCNKPKVDKKSKQGRILGA